MIKKRAVATCIVAFFITALTYAPLASAQATAVERAEARAWIDRAKSRWRHAYRLLWDYDRAFGSTHIPRIVGEMSGAEARAVIGRARSRFEEGIASLRTVIEAEGRAPNLTLLDQDNIYAQTILDALPADQTRALDRLAGLAAFLEDKEVAEIDGRIDRDLADSLMLHGFFSEHDRLLGEIFRTESIDLRRDSALHLWCRLASIDSRASSIEHEVRVAIVMGTGAEKLPRMRDELATLTVALRDLIPALRAVRGAAAEVLTPPLPDSRWPSLDPHAVFPILPEVTSRFADELEGRPAVWSRLTRDGIVGEHLPEWPRLVNRIAERIESTPPT